MPYQLPGLNIGPPPNLGGAGATDQSAMASFTPPINQAPGGYNPVKVWTADNLPSMNAPAAPPAATPTPGQAGLASALAGRFTGPGSVPSNVQFYTPGWDKSGATWNYATPQDYATTQNWYQQASQARPGANSPMGGYAPVQNVRMTFQNPNYQAPQLTDDQQNQQQMYLQQLRASQAGYKPTTPSSGSSDQFTVGT